MVPRKLQHRLQEPRVGLAVQLRGGARRSGGPPAGARSCKAGDRESQEAGSVPGAASSGAGRQTVRLGGARCVRESTPLVGPRAS